MDHRTRDRRRRFIFAAAVLIVAYYVLRRRRGLRLRVAMDRGSVSDLLMDPDVTPADVSLATSFYHAGIKMFGTAFQSVFRLTRPEFDELCNLARPHFRSPSGRGAPLKHTVEEHIMMLLLHLGYGLPFRLLGAMFALGPSTAPASAMRMVQRATAACMTALDGCVKMPTPRELEGLVQYSWDKFGIPFAVAAVDGTHIRINPTSPQERESAFCYKHFYSTNLLAVVTPDRKFIFTQVGAPGRCHDAHVMGISDLDARQRDVPDAERLIPPPYVILADAAFPLSSWCIKPYGAVAGPRQRFDQALSSYRMCVERAFAFLKQCWRILHYTSRRSTAATTPLIRCAIRLHNFMLERRTFIDGELRGDNVDNDDGFAAALGGAGNAEMERGRAIREEMLQRFLHG